MKIKFLFILVVALLTIKVSAASNQSTRIANEVEYNSIRSIQNNANSTIVTYDIPKDIILIDTINSQSHTVSIKMFAEDNVEGHPMTLFRKDMIYVPDNCVANVEIIDSAYYEIPLNLSPSRIPVTYDTYKLTELKPYSGFYPNYIVENAELTKFKGHSIQSIKINPIQFNQENGIARIYTHIKYRITYTAALLAHSSKIQPKELSVQDRERLSGILINGNELPSAMRSVSENNDLGNHLGYLIISHPKYNDAVQELAHNKRLLGYDVYSNFSESWDNQSILDCISQTYEKCPNLTYICLFGNDTEVPSYHNKNSVKLENKFFPSDYYYASLGDNNKIIPDFICGRICVSNEDDANSVVQKLTDYEFDDNDDDNFYNKCVHMGQFDKYAGDNSWSPTTRDQIGFVSRVNIIADSVESKYNKIIERLYWARLKSDPQFWENGSPISKNLRKPLYQWRSDSTDFINVINNGINYILYHSHGGVNRFEEPKVDLKDIKELNNIGKYPFIILLACQTGRFSGDTGWNTSMANELLHRKNGGASGVIAGTDNNYIYINDHYVFAIMNTMFGKLDIKSYDGGKYNQLYNANTMGRIMTEALDQISPYIEESRFLQYRQNYHLFGDPAMTFHLNKPSKIGYTFTLAPGQFNIKLYQAPANTQISIIDYYEGKVTTLNISSPGLFCNVPYKTEDIGFTETCITAPYCRPSRIYKNPGFPVVLINKSTSENSEMDGTSTLIGNAFYNNDNSTVNISSQKMSIETEKVTILPGTIIEKDSDFSIIINDNLYD